MRFRNQCAHREAVPQRLGQGHDIRLDFIMHVAEEFSCPGKAGLYFIHYHEQAFIITELPYLLQVARRRNIDPPFPLDGLQHDSPDMIINGCFKGIDLPVRDRDESLGDGIKPFPEFTLSRSGNCCERSAVKGSLKGYDAGAPAADGIAVLPGKLYGRFIGLCARVAEKHPRVKGMFSEHCRKLFLLWYPIEVRAVEQLLSLFTKGCHHLVMGMAKIAHGNTRYHVQIFFAGIIPNQAAFPPHQFNRKPGICLHYVIHVSYSLIICVPMPEWVNNSRRIE